MISGNDYTGLNNCGYLNGNLQNASDMLLTCIGDKSKGEAGLCTSSYSKLYDNISFNSQFINIKRGMGAGYSIKPYKSEILEQQITVSPNVVEGFTNSHSGVKEFIVPPGPGETNIEEKCGAGYTYKNNKCIQVCTNCKYRDNMKSQEFNEYDKCFPNGVYNGIGKGGEINCSCGKDNKYCSQEFLNNVYSAEGVYQNSIKNLNLSNLF